MRQLILTGLGNEVDFSTGKTVFTAVFNGKVRIEITQEAAKLLTEHAYSSAPQASSSANPPGGQLTMRASNGGGYAFEEEQGTEEFGGDEESPPLITDNPGSVFDEDTGVEQV